MNRYGSHRTRAIHYQQSQLSGHLPDGMSPKRKQKKYKRQTARAFWVKAERTMGSHMSLAGDERSVHRCRNEQLRRLRKSHHRQRLSRDSRAFSTEPAQFGLHLEPHPPCPPIQGRPHGRHLAKQAEMIFSLSPSPSSDCLPTLACQCLRLHLWRRRK